MKKTLITLTTALVLAGCYGPFHQELTEEVHLWGRSEADVSDARQVNTNFYIAQEMESGEVFGVTDELYLETDQFFTIFAEVPEDETRIPARLTFELRNPDNHVVTTEHRVYSPQHATGITFDAQKLAREGGQGAWTALFFADGYPLGMLDFGIYHDLATAEQMKEALAQESGEVGELRKSEYIVK